MKQLNTSAVAPANNYIVVDLNGVGWPLFISNGNEPKFYEIEE